MRILTEEATADLLKNNYIRKIQKKFQCTSNKICLVTECGCESKVRAKYSRVCSPRNQVNDDAEMADTGGRAGFRRKIKNFVLYLVSLHMQVKMSNWRLDR